MFSISFENSCSCWNHSVEPPSNNFAKVTKSSRHFEAKKSKQTYQFSVNRVTCKREILLTYLLKPLNSLMDCSIPFFCFLRTAFSLNWSNSDSETSTKLAALLKTAGLQCYNHRAVIVAGWSEAPSMRRSQRSIFDNHQCNYTNSQIAAITRLSALFTILAMFIGSSFIATSCSKNVSDLPSFLQLYQNSLATATSTVPFSENVTVSMIRFSRSWRKTFQISLTIMNN